MKKISLKEARTQGAVFKCPDCPVKYDNLGLLNDHVERTHADNIPEGVTTKRYLFNRKYKKTKGSCVICKRETKWNEEVERYERYCGDKCRSVARERFRHNAKRKLGTDNPASTVEHQIKAIKGRSYSGEYVFKDGVNIGYSSSLEKDFLRFCEHDLGLTSQDVEQCEIIFEYLLNGKMTFHIPDYFIPSLNLIIQIKTWKNMNSHVQTTGKLRQKLADKAIIDNGNYNYITILDMEYADFVNMVKILEDKALSEIKNESVVICIPAY